MPDNDFNLLKFINICLWTNIRSILENISYVLEKNVCSGATGWNVFKCLLSLPGLTGNLSPTDFLPRRSLKLK